MRLSERKIYCPFLVALFLTSCPLVSAQESKANIQEARGLLKRLESYENKYLAPEELALKVKPTVKFEESKVMAKQQEVLVSEVLKLRSQVSQLESQISQGQEKADFSAEEQKLISELTRERKRGDDLEKELAEEKSKDFSKLNRDLSTAQSTLETERQRADRKEKQLKEINDKVSQLEVKLEQQQDLKKALIKLRNESEQMQLQLDSRNGLDSDNEFLRKSLAEEKQKSSDIIKKSKELVQKISLLEQEVKNKKADANAELESNLKESQKRTSLLKESNNQVESEKAELSKELASYKKELSELQDKEKVLRNSLELTTESAKNSATELTSLKGQHSVLQTEVSQCQGQLTAESEELERLKSVEKELIAAKNELLLKNTTAELLSAGPSKRQREIRAKAAQSTREQTMDSATQKKYLETKLAFENAQKTLSGASAAAEGASLETPTGEARVLTVVGSKVNLRNGPGMEHSPVMQVSEGSKLTMETKEGEWYRVYTPTGSRAYIHQDEVSLEDGANVFQASTDITQQVAGPAKRPLRGRSETSELVPFGKVKVAGAIDTEDLAIRKLKATMGRHE